MKKITLIFLLQFLNTMVFIKEKEDDKDNENTKEGIVIKDVRVSPYALKRKCLVELLIINEQV